MYFPPYPCVLQDVADRTFLMFDDVNTMRNRPTGPRTGNGCSYFEPEIMRHPIYRINIVSIP